MIYWCLWLGAWKKKCYHLFLSTVIKNQNIVKEEREEKTKIKEPLYCLDALLNMRYFQSYHKKCTYDQWYRCYAAVVQADVGAFYLHFVVPENIHVTPALEGHWKFWGVGGIKGQKFLRKVWA